GTIVSGASYIVPNTSGCRSSYAGCPAGTPAFPIGTVTFGDITPVTMKSDAVTTTAGGCANVSTSGMLTVTVTTPIGIITTAKVGITD
ncbi:MAG: hypothetical protein AAB278_03655, partial [Pseudomonadota bacterium]